MKRYPSLILIFLVFLVALAGCKRDEKPFTDSNPKTPAAQQSKATPADKIGTEVGAIMPDYSATWLDGSKFELTAHRDKVILLNLWATWCGPCRIEIPELEKMHVALASKGFEVIGVSVDDNVDTVKEFVAEQKMTYPVAFDPKDELSRLFKTSVIPVSILIDRKGKIVWKQSGTIDANDVTLREAIEKAL